MGGAAALAGEPVPWGSILTDRDVHAMSNGTTDSCVGLDDQQCAADDGCWLVDGACEKDPRCSASIQGLIDLGKMDCDTLYRNGTMAFIILIVTFTGVYFFFITYEASEGPASTELAASS